MDLTPWIEYFVAGLATQLEEVKARGADATRADVVAREKKLNARQSAILAELYSTEGLALADLEAFYPSVNRRTLQRDLKSLLDKGLLREIGAATDPNRRYVRT